MNEILSWLAWGVGALVLAAAVVAGWEHLMREAAGRRFDCAAHAETSPRRLSIDVRLDTQPAALQTDSSEKCEMPGKPEGLEAADPPTDRQNRLAAMAQALSRAADPSRAPPDRGRWMDTTPRVVVLKEPALGQRERPRQEGSSQAG